MGDWKYSSVILNLGIKWRWVDSFTPRPLRPRYPLLAGWGPEPVWNLWRWEILFHCQDSKLNSLANRCINWAIANNIFDGKYQRKTPLVTGGHRSDANIKTPLKLIWCKHVHKIKTFQNRQENCQYFKDIRIPWYYSLCS
jgi:hypothetical protein